MSRKAFFRLLFGGIIVALAIWGFYVEPASLRVQRLTLEVPNWPASMQGLRVALLSDLHVGSPYQDLSKLRRIVALTNEERPDVILFLGDLVIQGVLGGHFIPPEESAAELGYLKAPLGVYGVIGNHDWWLNGARVKEALRQQGMHLLEDTSSRLTVRKTSLWLAGVSDYVEGRHDLKAALQGIPDGEPILLLSHNPDIFPEVPARVALTVSGHTHGGQVYVPFIGRPMSPSKYGRRYAAGHVIEDGRHLFVTMGTGTSILPLRIGSPPEVVVLTLNSEQRGAEERSPGNR